MFLASNMLTGGITEAEKYFTSDSALKCKLTAYAEKQGMYTNSDGFFWWWLRSPGFSLTYAAYVRSYGFVEKLGGDVDNDDNAVRPALWINLNP